MLIKLFVLILFLSVFPATTLQGVVDLGNPQSAAPADVYNADDIAVIHRIIDANGLDWERWTDGDEPPDNWRLDWSCDAVNKRVVGLWLSNKGLTGTLDMSGLTELSELRCNDNQLSALDVSMCAGLSALECEGNPLSHLKLPDGTELIVAVVPEESSTVMLTAYDHHDRSVTLTAEAIDGIGFRDWGLNAITTDDNDLSDWNWAASTASAGAGTKEISFSFRLPATTVTIKANFLTPSSMPEYEFDLF